MRRIGSVAAVVLIWASFAGAQTPATSFRLPGLSHWMSVPADLDGDGADEIVMTTMDPGKTEQLTDPTPVFILSVIDGQVVDRSPEFFAGTPPRIYSGKPTVADFDGDGLKDILLCDRGRQVAGARPGYGAAGTLGSWRAQNQVWMRRGGVFVNQPAAYPEVIQDSWGCSAGDVDASGRASLVINTFGPVPGFTPAYMLKWDGTSFVRGSSLARFDTTSGAPWWGFSATADFDNNGYADVVGARRVFWSGPGINLASQPTASTVVRPLEPSQVELAGYTFIRGTLTADFTGDGFPDLVKVGSLGEPTFGEARFALYVSGGALPVPTLTEKLDAFPAVESYNTSDFGNELAVLDINGDGFLDITTFGAVYAFASFDGPGNQRPPTAVWINDGTGRFSLAHWTDADLESTQPCKYWQSYFLKTATPGRFNVVAAGCRLGDFVAKGFGPDAPLAIVP